MAVATGGAAGADRGNRGGVSDAFGQMRLDGKVLVVTGSTQGLGAAIAQRAAELGAAGIVVTGRDSERGESVCSELERSGTPALFVQAELSDPDDCAAIIAGCDDRFGRLDGLVNAAGLSTRGTIEDTSVEL